MAATHDLTQFLDARGTGRTRYFPWRQETLGTPEVGDTVNFKTAQYTVIRIGQTYRNHQGIELTEVHLSPVER